MLTLKHFAVFLIVQNTVLSSYIYSPDYWFYSLESSESKNNEETPHPDSEHLNSEIISNELCPEKDYSSISYRDIKYLIDDKAEKLQIKENLVNSYYAKAEVLFEKYWDELDDIRNVLGDRPGHMLDILNDMASSRQNLQPTVEAIAVRLQDFYTLEQNYNNISESSIFVLNRLENYKKICQINCENNDIENRLRHEIMNNPLNISKSHLNNTLYCVRLKDLIDYINTKLSQFEAQYGQNLCQDLKMAEEIYAQKLKELKINLKEAVVKKFGMTMYDILSLQDDYHHFVEDLKKVNISSNIDNIEENSAEIKLKLIGLKRDVEKYKQYCMKCMNPRVKRNVIVFGMQNGKNTIIGAESNIIDKALSDKIDEIKETIKRNFTDMFEELDEDLNDPDIVEIYMANLQPIQNIIDDDIEIEQEALSKLRNLIPKASIDNILKLSEESKQMIQSLESAKQFIDKFVL